MVLLWCLCPYSGNHERDWPGTGSFYENKDSGGECGVLAQTMFYTPASNRAKVWYDNMTPLFEMIITKINFVNCMIFPV